MPLCRRGAVSPESSGSSAARVADLSVDKPCLAIARINNNVIILVGVRSPG